MVEQESLAEIQRAWEVPFINITSPQVLPYLIEYIYYMV